MLNHINSSGTAIRPSILAHDNLCQPGVRRSDIDRVLKSFFIIPHNQQPPFLAGSQGQGWSAHAQEELAESSAVSIVSGP